jgi:hypothetical protein
MSQESLDARLHLAGRLVCERDRQNTIGINPQIGDQVGCALGQDASLAGTGASKYENRPVAGGDSGSLLVVQLVKHIH